MSCTGILSVLLNPKRSARVARSAVHKMTNTKLTKREFNQDVSKAMRAAQKGPVFVTDSDQISYVLLSIKAYQAITDRSSSIADRLAMPEADEIEFEPARATGVLYRPTDFS